MNEVGMLMVALALLSLLGGGLAILMVFCNRVVLGKAINPELGPAKTILNKAARADNITMPVALLAITVFLGRTITGVAALIMMVVFAILAQGIISENEVVFLP